MKNAPVLCLAACLVSFPLSRGEEPAKAPAAVPPATPVLLAGWGEAVDPAQDSQFTVSDTGLLLVVAGSDRPHDLSAELGNVDAPRVLQPMTGDFKIEVKVDGLFSPGGESTQPGRTGYTGAGVVIMADDNNYVRLERAALQFSGDGQAHAYINFEIRLNGQLVSIGTTGDHKTPTDQPVWLRLERKGLVFHGATRQEGEEWSSLPPKELPSAWPAALKAGVHAVSTSRQVFSPKFSDLKVAAAPAPK